MARTSALWTRYAALCCATALLAGCTGIRPQQATGAATADAPTTGSELQELYRDVVQDVLPSVVQITTTDGGLGSGIVYDSAGHIVTNAHVLADDTTFEVLLATGQEPLTAELVAAYPEQDLAVIVLEDAPRQLRPATFGNSSKVEVGEIVLAMGNPLGLSSSVTQGIVSAVGRAVSEDEGGRALGNMVQTSAAINPGNSGGALVNLSGQVIGIPTLAARDPQLGGGQAPGIGFAIPSATVTHLADQMIEHGEVIDSGRAALGVSVRTVLGEGFQPAGAAIVETAEDGPADRAGLRPGDVLVQLGSETVTDVASLAEALAAQQPGRTVEVTYRRHGERRTAEVRLGEA
ncbi:trypsin-like peptidase domain-containing protein [Streptomyces sodiiphilus]|uniref:Trypsin-like peptidase domain-containing protein n=1 Tax=Streptomyces sodiiphilus TaxID=226217 RepID=A0ABN2PVW4_9ACTN